MTKPSLTENEIRPKELFDQYLKLSEEDGKRLDHGHFSRVSCPACHTPSTSARFTKYGFNFDECPHCMTLFCNPRPTQEQLAAFYVNSKSADFWSQKFLPVVESARREKLVKPKVKEMVAHLASQKITPKRICDVGASHGFMLDEFKTYFGESEFYAIEPDAYSCKILKSKGIHTMQALLGEDNEWNGKMDFVTSYEVFEHVNSPETFIKHIYQLLAPNGISLITTLNCEGFDILTLGADSKSISPPHHLNFFSLQGFEILLKKIGFKEIKIMTPGKLDVDIVLNSGFNSPLLEVLKKRGPEALADFQEFLVSHNLSSHTWIWAKK